MKKLYWNFRKLIQPDFVLMRNAYIQRNINELEKIKSSIGGCMFKKYYGMDYIENMKNDLV